jgi:hypothetical protein
MGKIWMWLHMPVIPASGGKHEIGRSWSSLPFQKGNPISKTTRPRGMAQVVKHPPGKHKALSPNPSNTNNNNNNINNNNNNKINK